MEKVQTVNNKSLKLFEYWSDFHQTKKFCNLIKNLRTFVSTTFFQTSGFSSFKDVNFCRGVYLIKIATVCISEKLNCCDKLIK